MVSHRFSTVVDADLILVLHEGRLIETGDHDTLLAQSGHYAERTGCTPRRTPTTHRASRRAPTPPHPEVTVSNHSETIAAPGWHLTVPDAFAAGVVQHTKERGAAWLAELPSLTEALMRRWDLTPEPDAEVMHGFLGVVVPVRRGAERYALKVGQPSEEVHNQVTSLTVWDGQGMVRMAEADPAAGALLLERLDHRRSLDDIDLGEAVDTAARLLRRLAVPAAGAPLPTLDDHVADWPERWLMTWQKLDRPLPRRLLDAAAERCRALGPLSGRALVDHDLHFRNVLAGEREPWLAIDPRGVLGDAEFALAPLLWNRFVGPEEVPERFARFTDLGDLDTELARGWALVRVVDYFLWSTGAGLTWDPAACRIIADWIVGPQVVAPQVP